MRWNVTRRRDPVPPDPCGDETLEWDPREGRPATHPAPEPKPEPRRRGFAARALRRLGVAALKLFIIYYVFCLLLLVAYKVVDPPTTGVQIQRRLEARSDGRAYRLTQGDVAMRAMSPHVAHAVVSAEDGRFWTHNGFDLVEMRKAGERAVDGGRVRGASTITQQLMKNLFGCACRNPVRKVYDLALTPAAELILGKHRILEIYLNHVEWGPGIFGIDAAARHHYGVSARRLSRSQAAGLAALLPNPIRRTPQNTGAYRRNILRRMAARGW